MTTISVDLAPDPPERLRSDTAALMSRTMRLREIDGVYEAILNDVREERAHAIRYVIRESGERLAPALAKVTVSDDGHLDGPPLQATIATRALVRELRTVPAQLTRVYTRYGLVLGEIEEAWAEARSPFDFVLAPASEHRNEAAK